MLASLRGAIVRIAVLALCLTIFAGGVSAYSFWVFFPNASTPFAPLPAKLDLRVVKDNTVQFFISDQGPAALVLGDSATGEAVLTSVTAFHGRVFSEPFLHPDEPQLWVTAFEAIAGLVIEGVFIAMLTQKFFGK